MTVEGGPSVGKVSEKCRPLVDRLSASMRVGRKATNALEKLAEFRPTYRPSICRQPDRYSVDMSTDSVGKVRSVISCFLTCIVRAMYKAISKPIPNPNT